MPGVMKYCGNSTYTAVRFITRILIVITSYDEAVGA
jgi:hypothetical protein